MRNNLNYQKILNNIFEKYNNRDFIQRMDQNGKISHFTYGDVKQQISLFQEKIKLINLNPGDRVLLLDDQSPDIMLAFIIFSYLNLTPVMIDSGLPKTEIETLILSSNLSAIFTSKDILNKLSNKVKESLPFFDIRDIKNNYPLFENEGLLSISNKYDDIDPNVAVIIFSSGTAGSLKAVEITYEAFLNSVEEDIRISGITNKDNMLLVFPLFHISGLYSAMTIILSGNTLYMLDKFKPSELSYILHTYNPEAFGMVPKVFEIMVQKFKQELKNKNKIIQRYYEIAFNISAFFNRYFSFHYVGKILLRPFAVSLFGKNIRILPVGATSCDAKTAETLINMGLRWFYVYSSTECGVPITAVGKNDKYQCDTVGRVDSVKNVDILIKEPDIRGVGEILVKTDKIMKGYYGDEELTESSFCNGYFKTGDLGYIDRNNYLHITGRVKETIILENGKKVSPSDLEFIISSKNIPYEVALCGVTDQLSGFDKIYAFVADNEYSEEEKNKCCTVLKEILNAEGFNYSIEQFLFVHEIPKTALGKIKRSVLIEMLNKDKDELKSKKIRTKAINNTDENLSKRILAIFASETDENDCLSLNSSWRNINGIDSLKLMVILSKIEEETGTSIGENIIELKTIGDIVNYCCKNRINAKDNTDKDKKDL